MRNILYICEYRATYSGNFIKSLFSLKCELENRGCDCYFIFPKQAESRDWVKIIDMGSVCFLEFNQNNFLFEKEVIRFVKKKEIDIIHSHFLSVNKAKMISLFCKNAKMFVHIHSDFSMGVSSLKYKIVQYLNFNLLASRLHFVCVSNDFIKFCPRNSVWIPNAIANNETAIDDNVCKEFRKKNNISENDFLIELYGWSPKVKGVDIAVEAIKIANMNGFNYKLMIVCGVKYDEKEMKKYISENTSCTGNEKFLIFAPPIEDVFLYHNVADVLLSTSRSEGFPYSIGEMLSLGKRCVISSIPGTNWALEYESVVPFQSEDFLSCEEAIVKSEGLDNYNKNVQMSFSEKYSINNWVDNIIGAYQDNVK